MAIFLLTKVQEPISADQRKFLEAALDEKFAGQWHGLGNGNYLVSTVKPLTVQDFSKDCGLTEGSAGSYFVSVVDSYYGWASRVIWDWMKTMRERDERF